MPYFSIYLCKKNSYEIYYETRGGGVEFVSPVSGNVIDIKEDGGVYIRGIGGYDGTNPESASTIQAESAWEAGSVENSIQQRGTGAEAKGVNSIAEGGDNLQGGEPASGEEKLYAKSEGYASHAEGSAHAIGRYSHAEGGGNSIESGHPTRSTAEGPYSHAEGTHTHAIGNGSHGEGQLTIANSHASHAEGRLTVAGTDIDTGKYAHAEGFRTSALGENSHSEGGDTVVKGNSSHVEGYLSSSVGANAHSEGRATFTNGNGSHSEGYSRNLYEYAPGRTVEQIESLYDDSPFAYSSGNGTHSEGYECIAMGTGAHAEGHSSKAIAGWGVHAEGWKSVAKGDASHAEGSATETKNSGEHAEGRYNKSNKASNNYEDARNTRHSVGIGTSDSNRKNAFEIMSNGDAYLYGVGGYMGTSISGATKLQDMLTVSAGTYSIYSEETDAVVAAYGNIIYTPGLSGRTISATVDDFYKAYMSSIGAFRQEKVSSMATMNKISELSLAMANVSMFKFPLTGGSITEYPMQNRVYSGNFVQMSQFTYQHSVEGAQIQVAESGVTIRFA